MLFAPFMCGVKKSNKKKATACCAVLYRLPSKPIGIEGRGSTLFNVVLFILINTHHTYYYILLNFFGLLGSKNKHINANLK